VFRVHDVAPARDALAVAAATLARAWPTTKPRTTTTTT
jgi:dihydropteroate synthase